MRRNLDMNSFKSIKLWLPSDEEQKKIADFLTSVDEKIEAHQEKLKQAKHFKKALLQRMFV